ncbi:hypothetical protein MON38_16670 [Hymenobacter sp. DH14]|uniref:Uncharacterized protein n=1 Tax=Hymenobacter cyanobacteriorum TaxID=2926463 RepID=A0A9X1VH40_9BACT|nr:hypothetical protein [Hymenobacter cyanobacteriorum]MCI1189059.1 hypothetical protein [Hymenobacter cyanobacteriorum]
MLKLLLFLKIFNTAVTVVIFVVVGFLSCAFFLGDRETHELLKQHAVGNFCLRFFSFALFGIVLSILPILINALICWRTSIPMPAAYRFAQKAVLVSTISALGGTAVFFCY